VSFTWAHSAGCHAQYGYLGSTASMVTSRTVDANDGTGPHTWHYSGNSVTDPLGNDVVHTFTDLSGCSLFETQTQYYAGSSSNGTLLKTVKTDYSWSPNPDYGGPNPPPAMNVVPIRVTTIWANGQTAKTEYSYDSGFTFTGVADGIQHTGIYGKQTAV